MAVIIGQVDDKVHFGVSFQRSQRTKARLSKWLHRYAVFPWASPFLVHCLAGDHMPAVDHPPAIGPSPPAAGRSLARYGSKCLCESLAREVIARGLGRRKKSPKVVAYQLPSSSLGLKYRYVLAGNACQAVHDVTSNFHESWDCRS